MKLIRCSVSSSVHRFTRGDLAFLQIECDAGLPSFQTSEDAAARAAKFIAYFKASQHLYEGTDEKDRGPADDLPVLAISALVAAWKLDSSRQPKHLLQVDS